MVKARRISIILYDGDPEALREADIQVSTIKAVAFPRTQLQNAIAEVSELRSPGSYILFGPDPETDQPTAYIGETEDVARRLGQHIQNANTPGTQEKYDHWVNTIAIVSKDRSLSKSHALYLESRLTNLASKNPAWKHRAGKTTGADAGALTKADRIAMEEVLEQAILLTGTLGLDLFRMMPAEIASKEQGNGSASDALVGNDFRFASKEWNASMRVLPTGQLLVLKGAKFRKVEATTLAPSTKNLRANMIQQGLLVSEADFYALIQDQEFNSVSAAAGAVSGSTVNGRIAWKDLAGRTFAEVESSTVPELVATVN